MRKPVPCVAVIMLAGALALAQEEPKEVANEEARASAIQKVEPAYPKVARQLKVEGRVEINAYVRPDGTVAETIIVLGNPILTAPTEAAVKQWRFKPFREGGKPVKAIARLVFFLKP